MVVVESCLIIVSPLVDAAAILLLQVLVDDVLLPRDFGAFPPEVAPFVGVTLLVGVPRRQSTELTPERKFPSTRQTTSSRAPFYGSLDNRHAVLLLARTHTTSRQLKPLTQRH